MGHQGMTHLAARVKEAGLDRTGRAAHFPSNVAYTQVVEIVQGQYLPLLGSQSLQGGMHLLLEQAFSQHAGRVHE
jgi:hypothetical protein